MTGELQLILLGKLEIQRDGVPLAGLTSAKAQALLCYLAATGRSHFRTTLAGLLWGDMPETNARTNLRRELSALRRTVSDHLIITRQEVAFSDDAPYWLDVEAFQAATDQGTIEGLREAVELYRGDFLEGFYIRDAPAFEEWVLVQQTRLRELALQALHRLSSHYAEQGEAGLEEGITYTSRLLALEPSREEAHRGLMLLLALSGQRGAALAQYEVCRQALAEDLGVEPGPETRELYERIRDGQVGRRSAQVPRTRVSKTLPSAQRVVDLPEFLTEARVERERPVFVARDRELEWLDGCLENALAGQGQVAFITGGPGRGKTALMTEFARRSMERHPELLLGMGNCNAYAGLGDPYLPFREALGMLTGDTEARWAAGVISREHAHRMWQAVPLASRALLDFGPYLIGTLVPGPGLISRAAATVGDDGGLGELQRWAQRETGVQAELQQNAIFEQYTNVLRALAEQRPLLLLLDDLQWTDTASAGLLFHLGRRLAGARILVVGAYRQDEIALGLPATGFAPHPRIPERSERTGDRGRHPLDKALAEFKRQFGDVWLDLSQTEDIEGRRFVDALLATQPNQLGADFRDELARHTAGHALFTVELLHAMQERGDLARDAQGQWVRRRAVDWAALPARVEAVIEERVARLGLQLRDILAVASVEGETFTAQVVGQVQGIDEREMLRLLSQELRKRHRLVREQGAQTVAGKRLSRYRFAHALFQEYLYSGLSEGERALLHREVGVALEALYEGHTEEIAAQLVNHFAGAGDLERERHYARLAGERAAAQYASEEAVGYLSRALDLTPETDYDERFAILLAREREYRFQGDPDSQVADLAALELLAGAFEGGQQGASKGATALLRRAKFTEEKGNLVAALAASQAGVRLAQLADDVELEVWGQFIWALTLAKQGDAAEARSKYQQALALARAAGDATYEAHCLRGLGTVHLGLGDFAEAEAYMQRSLALFREMGARQQEAWILLHLSLLSITKNNLTTAEAYLEQSTVIARQIGWPTAAARAPIFRGWIMRHRGHYCQAQLLLEQAALAMREIDLHVHGWAVIFLGCVLQDLGDYAGAQVEFERALCGFREISARADEGRAMGRLALLSHQRGKDAAALEQGQQALAIAQDLEYRNDEAYALTYLGHALASLGQLDEADGAYRSALETRDEFGQSPLVAEVQAGLARVALVRNEPADAQNHVEQILSHLQTGSVDGADEPLRIYLTCYRVLKANGDPRAEDVLDEAHNLLQERAAKIDGESLRRSYLENVAAHRELVREWQASSRDEGARP
jgi:adenylate cyclase